MVTLKNKIKIKILACEFLSLACQSNLPGDHTLAFTPARVELF